MSSYTEIMLSSFLKGCIGTLFEGIASDDGAEGKTPHPLATASICKNNTMFAKKIKPKDLFDEGVQSF